MWEYDLICKEALAFLVNVAFSAFRNYHMKIASLHQLDETRKTTRPRENENRHTYLHLKQMVVAEI